MSGIPGNGAGMGPAHPLSLVAAPVTSPERQGLPPAEEHAAPGVAEILPPGAPADAPHVLHRPALPQDRGPVEEAGREPGVDAEWLSRALAGALRQLKAHRVRLDHLLQTQRRFASDASHELLTPIAALRLQLEEARLHPDKTVLQELLRDSLEDLDRLQAIVADLLVLARIGSGPPGAPVGTDLAEVVLAEVAGRRPRPCITTRLAANLPVGAADHEVRRLVRNLLDNAQCHAIDLVLVETHRDGEFAELSVDDDGDGVAPADRERVFGWFTRADGARSRVHGGTGLGLAIVHDIAESYGGSVGVTDSAAGGARFLLRLPLAEQALIA
ncbi:sensor histidine kinase [Microbispora sp. NPDC004025]